MSILECFPMRKRRYQNTSRTPKLSPCETGQHLRRTPRRIRSESQSLNNSLTEQCGLEIIWDNQSPSPGRVLKLGKRKKVHGSDSSSGGEISDLVKKLADQSGSTPEANPLLKFWMCREGEEKQQQDSTGRAILKQKNNVFQTPARKPRRAYRRSNRATVKQLTKELELLAHHANEPEADELLCENAVVEEKSLPTGIQDNLVPSLTSIATEDTKNGECMLPDEAELFDMWDSDESDDLILSQVDMSAVYNGAIQGTQVLMQTQILGSVEDMSHTVEELVDTKGNKPSDDDCIVTEVWDFVEELGDSDSEEFLQTALEDFEKSQNVPTVKNKTPSNSRSPHIGSEKGPDLSASGKQPQTHGSKLTSIIGQCKNNSELVYRSNVREASCRKDENLSCTINSRLKSLRVSTEKETVSGHPPATRTHCASVPVKGPEDKMTRKNQMPCNLAASRNCATSSVRNGVVTRANQWTGSAASEQSKKTPKPVQKYTKEDIERKRMLAQQKRKQKLSQVSKRNPTTSRISR